MTRNRASAKKAGIAFERLIADYLNKTISDVLMRGDIWIDRRARTGRRDKGDIAGLHRTNGASRDAQRVVVECKNEVKVKLPEWTREAHVEAVNDDALVGVVIHKRARNANPGEQWVTMTVADLVALVTGERPTETKEET